MITRATINKITKATPVPRAALDQGKLFIHIPKAAGTRISLELYGFQIGHWKAIDYMRCDRRKYESIFTFALVRDPVSRFLSAYRFLENGGMTQYDRSYRQENASSFSSIDKFLHDFYSRKISSHIHFELQADFVCDRRRRVIVDKVYRLEEVQEGKTDFSDRVSSVDFNIVKNQGPMGVETNLKESSKRILYEIYQKDFELFSY